MELNIDDNGVVNYTQLKPEGVEAERVSAHTGQRIAGTGSTPTAAATPPSEEGELNDSQQKMLADLRATEAERQRQVEEVRDANCQRARDVLGRLTSRGRIRVVGADGVERVMPAEERQERIDEAQRGVALNCAETASR